MTVTLVPADGVLGVIAKAASYDVDAATELWRISLFEALADLTERYGPTIDADFAKAAGASAARTRRALVRTYVGKRLAGADVDELLAAATSLAAPVTIGKAETAAQRRAAVRNELRNHGKWASRASGALDRVGAFAGGNGLSDFVGPDGPGTDRRIYRQLKATGHALAGAGVAQGNAHAMLIGQAASLIGDLGPEAEKVLGNPIRRTAYRYRGTERRPDRALQLQARRLNTQIDAIATADRQDPAAALALRQRLAGGAADRRSDVDAVLAYNTAGERGRTFSADQLRLAATSDLATAQLARTLPDLEHARLSLASGKLPPSQGVIIDADGDLVSEAQGVNGDHYLPFDLANLKRLHGGAYVRTRTTGGPTDEDIYTGLLTGARQVQVVSASGVFTVEFDPDLRGGRRYSDKARAMVGRYTRLLAAVGSDEVYANDLTPTEQAGIRQRVASQYRDAHLPPDKLHDLITEETDRERQARRYATRSDEELLDAADTQARAELKGKPGGDAQLDVRRADIYRDLRRDEDKQAVRAYRLDGNGYHAALKSLKQEFPFFIRRVDYKPLPDWLAVRRLPGTGLPAYLGTDLGRVRPGQLTPAGVRHAGWKDPEAAPTPPPAVEPVAGEQPKQPTATATPAAGATAGTAGEYWLAPGTKPLTTALKDDQAAFQYDLGRAVKKLTLLATDKGLQGQYDYASEHAEAQAGVDNGAFVTWAKTASPNEIAAWLIADPHRIDRPEQVLKDVAALPFDQAMKENADLPGLQARLSAARILSGGFTPPGPDPALTAPDDGRPVLFGEIDRLGDKMSNYTGYLQAHPEVAKQIPAIADDLEHAPDDLADEVHQYTAMLRWAGSGFNADDRGPLTDADRDEAAEAARLGQSSTAYRELDARQKAYAFIVQQQALAALTGAAVPDLPAAGEPAPKAEPSEPADAPADKKITKRNRRVIVHPPGSPVSVALAKRQASRSPRPVPAQPRRRPTS